MRFLFAMIVLMWLVQPTAGKAQDHHAILVGKVTDENGMPLSGTTVNLVDPIRNTITDEQGGFLLKLPYGNFKLMVSRPGYQTLEKQVHVSNKIVREDLQLVAVATMMKEVAIIGLKPQSATAVRTLVPIHDIPQAISIVGHETIQQQAAFDLTTIARNMVGLNFTGNYSGAGSSQFYNARGFDLNDSQNYRWNGVMVWNWGNQYADNIEQVEFLKGPTSILYGDVAPGGILNFVTKKPLAAFQADASLRTGSWGLFRPAIDVTGPISKDRSLRYRINTSFERSDSFRDKVSSQRKFIAPALAWDITPNLLLNVEGVFKRSKATDDAGLVSPDGTVAGLEQLDPTLYLGEPSRSYLFRDNSLFATLSYQVSPTWRIKTTGYYANTSNRPFGLWFDQPDAAGDFVRRGYGFFQKAKNGTLAVDVLGSFYTMAVKHQVLFGVEFQTTSYRQTNGGELSVFDTNNINDPVYGQSVVNEPATSPFWPFRNGINRRGFHVQDQLKFFNERLQVLLGLRFGRTKQGNNYLENELPGTAFEGYTDDLVAKNIVSPRFGVVYKLKNGYSLYASFANGYEINQPDIFAQNYLEFASPPATLSSQLEAGIKMEILQHKLAVTLSAYEINKRNPYGYTYLDPINPNYDMYNVYYAGRHRSRGVELEADGYLLPGLSIFGGFAYTDAKVVYDPSYPKGNRLPNIPRFGANGWFNYKPVGKWNSFNFSTGIFYKSSFYSGIANNPALKIDESYTWDAAAAYQYQNIGLQLNVMNITKQVSYLNPWQFNLFDVRPLRQMVVTLTYHLPPSDHGGRRK